MANLILGTNNDAQSQTTLSADLDNTGEYGLQVQALDGNAVYGVSNLGLGLQGASPAGGGVLGSSSTNVGVSGISDAATGVLGATGAGVTSAALYAGVWGIANAQNQTAPGVVGDSSNSFGVRGQSGDASLLPPVGGGEQFLQCGVQGSSDGGTGVRGDSALKVGVRGRTYFGSGVLGSCMDQPNGPKTTGTAIFGSAPRDAANAQTGPFAGRFEGDVTITGRVFVGNTLIWFPPWLTTALITVAAGVAKLDQKGESVVELPKGTSRLHTNFHYQLTAMGVPAPDLHVAAPVSGDQFKIAGGAPNAKVSWHISGEPKEPKGMKTRSALPEKAPDRKAVNEFKKGVEDLKRRVKEFETQAKERVAGKR